MPLSSATCRKVRPADSLAIRMFLPTVTCRSSGTKSLWLWLESAFAFRDEGRTTFLSAGAFGLGAAFVAGSRAANRVLVFGVAAGEGSGLDDGVVSAGVCLGPLLAISRVLRVFWNECRRLGLRCVRYRTQHAYDCIAIVWAAHRVSECKRSMLILHSAGSGRAD